MKNYKEVDGLFVFIDKNSNIDDIIKSIMSLCGVNKVIPRIINKNNNLSGTKLYQVWKTMRQRCENPNNCDYDDYGGRGIKVCESWRDNPLSFYEWGLMTGWEIGLTLERNDNNKGYSPDNCRWATKVEQAQNKRNTLKIEYHGEIKSITEWSNELGLPRAILYDRIQHRKWDIERAFNTPNIGRGKYIRKKKEGD